ncbi:MAG TPA: ATP-binding protein [Planctomycetota bacterium]
MTPIPSDETITVVAIDDDPGDLEILQRHFEDLEGMRVDLHCHSEPAEALAEMLAHEPDCVFIDYLLGAATGVDIANSIRQNGLHCPVIIMSGQGSEKAAVATLHAGAADYMIKDKITPQGLKRALANALEKSRLERSVREHQRRQEKAVLDLTRRNQEVQRFYHTLSHELKTPLAAAREFASILLDGISGPLNADQSQYLGIVKDCCDQMTTQINDLLDVTRLETGKLVVDIHPEDLGGLARQVVRTFESNAAEKSIRMRCEIEDDLPMVPLDRVRVTQVVSNLMSNAFKFTAECGWVVVTARISPDEPGFVEVSVADNGRGISPDHQAHIFERLYQAEKNDFYLKGGMGLGLNICRDLVQLHGGTLSVSSEVGRGSTFTFTLPLERASIASPSANQLETTR